MLCSPKELPGLRIFIAISLSIILSCAGSSHGERQVSLRAAEGIYRDAPVQIDLDVSKRDLDQLLNQWNNAEGVESAKTLVEKGEFSLDRI